MLRWQKIQKNGAKIKSALLLLFSTLIKYFVVLVRKLFFFFVKIHPNFEFLARIFKSLIQVIFSEYITFFGAKIQKKKIPNKLELFARRLKLLKKSTSTAST